MFFYLRSKNKTVKELRKRQGYTVKELADILKIEANLISRIDERKLKDVPDPLRSKILPALRGDNLDRMM